MLFRRILWDGRSQRALRSLVLQSEFKKVSSPERERLVFLFNVVSCLNLEIRIAHFSFCWGFFSENVYLHVWNILWTLLSQPCKGYLLDRFLFVAFSIYSCRDVRERMCLFIEQLFNMKLWQMYLLCLFPICIDFPLISWHTHAYICIWIWLAPDKTG